MKYPTHGVVVPPNTSHPVRGAWIEMSVYAYFLAPKVSHPVRGAWIEMFDSVSVYGGLWSHPVRGAWIEILYLRCPHYLPYVAPREGCVD